MAQNDFTKLFDGEFGKNLFGFSSFPFDFNALIDVQRKNLQAFTEAHQLALEGAQAVAQRQGEILSQLLQDNSSLATQLLAEGTPEQKVAKQADLARKAYEKSVSNWREVADMLVKSNQEASDIINDRIAASLTELKTVLEKKTVANSSQKKAA